MQLTPHIARCYRSAALLVLVILCAGASPARAADAYSEDSVKAAYLIRFAGYISWPAEPHPDEAFTIAVLGSPGVARELRHLVPGHLINNRPVQVREVTGDRDLGRPQILYAGTGRAEAFRRVLPPGGLPSALLVTDEEGGLDAGSSLNFVVVDRRVRFEVSLTAADRSGLKISAELLGVAVRVHGAGKQSRDGCAPGPGDGGCGVRLARRVPSLPRRIPALGVG